MGDPRKIKKKYSKPSQMWQKARIEEEKAIINEYGLSNKREIWKAASLLRAFSRQAKRLIAFKSTQSERESVQLLDKLVSLGLIKSRNLEAVLDITLKDIMGRRLQTIVFKKSLARTTNQARQAITHAHIVVGNKKVTAPSYLVSVEDENTVGFSEKSPFFSAEHPERAAVGSNKQGGKADVKA